MLLIPNEEAVEILKKYPWVKDIKSVVPDRTYRVELEPIAHVKLQTTYIHQIAASDPLDMEIKNPMGVGVEISSDKVPGVMPVGGALYNATHIRFYETERATELQRMLFHPHMRLYGRVQRGDITYYQVSCCALDSSLYDQMIKPLDMFCMLNTLYASLTNWSYLAHSLLHRTDLYKDLDGEGVRVYKEAALREGWI